MPIAIFDKLSDLVKDYSKSFWNGDAQVSLQLRQLAQAVDGNPKVSFAQIRASSGSLVRSGIGFQTPDPLQLGALNGHDGFSLSFGVAGEATAELLLVLSPGALNLLTSPAEQTLARILGEQALLQPNQALLVLLIDGQVSANVSSQGSTLLSAPIKVGFDFKAGGGYSWFSSRRVDDQEEFLGILRQALSQARLPQTPLADVLQSGDPIDLSPGEIIGARLTGFLNMGFNGSLGYTFNGTRNFSLGKLDLATQVTLKAAAEMKAGFQLTGAYQILVSAGDTSGWNRIRVRKDHTSEFDFAITASVGISESTPIPQGEAFVEAVLGTTTGQVLKTALSYAGMSPQQLRQSADGFVQAVVTKWTGKAFDTLPQADLQAVLAKLQLIENQIEGLPQRAVDLYSRFLDRIDFPQAIGEINKILQAGDLGTQEQRLLGLVPDQDLRRFVEELVDEKFGTLFADYKNQRQKLVDRVNQFNQLVTGRAADEIRGFVQAKLQALKLDQIVAQLSQYDTPEKLRSKATSEAQELVSRLLNRPFNEIFDDPQVAKLVAQVNHFANDFQGLLAKIGNLASEALNQSGEFSLAYSYQRAKSTEDLIDVQILVGDNQQPNAEGLKLYGEAVNGDFRGLFENDNLPLLKIGQATFTESLKRSTELNVHIFGWSFEGDSQLLFQLQDSIEVGKSGLMTVYNLKAEGERKSQDSRRAISFNYLLQVSGQVEGAFPEEADLKAQAVSAQQVLGKLDNQFRYDIGGEIKRLDDLEAYFHPAIALGLIDDQQKANLIQSVQRMGSQGMNGAQYGKVGVSYTFTFDGPSLARALATDYSAFYSLQNDNIEALERIYADRLIATYFLPPRTIPSGVAVAALYQNGFLQEIKKVGNIDALQLPDTLQYRQGDLAVQVPVRKSDLMWAERHYLLNKSLSSFLDGFRQKIKDGGQIPFGDFEGFLKKLSSDLNQIDRGPQKALPLLLLDKMLRLSAGDSSTYRTAFVEVSLYDSSGSQVVATIPISG